MCSWSGPQNWDTASAELLNTLTDGDDEAAKNILSLLDTMYPHGEAAENEIRIAAGAENLDIGSIADSLRLINGGADSIGPLLMSGGTDGTGSAGNSLQSGFAGTTGEAGTGKATEGAGKVGKIITKIEYKPSSGVILKANPDKTTTILGSFDKDMKNIVNEMGNVKSTDFGAKKGGFNVLNVPDDMYKNADQFWNDVNKPWLDEVISRGDDIVLATKPTGRASSYIDINTGKEKITGFGREYKYLLDNGYDYDALTNMMIKK